MHDRLPGSEDEWPLSKYCARPGPVEMSRPSLCGRGFMSSENVAERQCKPASRTLLYSFPFWSNVKDPTVRRRRDVTACEGRVGEFSARLTRTRPHNLLSR